MSTSLWNLLQAGSTIDIKPNTVHTISARDSTNIVSGSLLTSGGLGVLKDLWCGGTIHGLVAPMSGPLTINDTTQSTSTDTGAIICAGGIGVAKNVNVGGNMKVDGTFTCPNLNYEQVEYVTSTAEATDTQTGASIISGGCGIAKQLYVGGDTHIQSTTQTTNSMTGALVVSGGIGCNSLRSDYVNGVNVVGDAISALFVTSTDTTDSTSPSTGSLKSLGGCGIAKSLYVGGITDLIGDVVMESTTVSSSTSTGSLIVKGGIACGPNPSYIDDVRSTQILAASGGFTNASVLATTDSTSSSTGSLLAFGGVGVRKTLTANKLQVDDTGASNNMLNINAFNVPKNYTSNINFNRYSDAGVTLGASSYISQNNFNGQLTIYSASNTIDLKNAINVKNANGHTLNISVNDISGDSTLDVSGNDLYLHSTDTIRIQNTGQATTTDTGALIISGGLGVAKNLYAGGIFELTTPPEQDVNVFASLSGAGGASMVIFDTYFRAYGFQDGTSNSVWYQVEIPHGAAKTTCVPHLHWSKSNSNSGNVHWLHYYTISNGNGAFVDQTPTVYIGYTIAVGATANVPIQSNLAAINLTGMTDPIIIHGRLERVGGDVLDTYNGDAQLHSIGYHYNVKRLGE